MLSCPCGWHGTVKELVLVDQEDVLFCLCPKCRANLGYTYCDDLQDESDFFTTE